MPSPIRSLALPLIAALCCAAAPASGAEPGYVLKPNDTVRIAVYQEDDLTTETRISKSGEITLPLVGPVHVAGRTISAAAAEIEALLDRDYIISPHVTLSVITHAPERVTVLGQVQRPGAIEIPEGGKIDVLSAIAMAGGYTPGANAARITLHRTQGEGGKVYVLDGEELATRQGMKPFYLEPEDVITVAEGSPETVTVMGEVAKPGMIDFPKDGGMDLLDAIAMAGGYTDAANPSRITVRRRVGDEEKLYLINGRKLADDPEARPFFVQPNDIIKVAESYF